MAQTSWSGPLASGDRPPGTPGGSNVGLVVLSQSVVINRDATLVQTASLLLPPNSKINNISADVLTAYDSATSALLSVGSAPGGTQYTNGVNVRTAGRAVAPATGPQCVAQADIGANTAVFATVTSVGQPTVGSVRVTVEYVQTTGI